MTLRRRGKGRGGKGGHEPRARLRLREAQVLEQVLEGRTQQQIADALGISQPAVSKIVRRIEDRLLADLAVKAERQRARQTLRLDYIYGQAIHAWQESKQEGVRRRQRKTEHDGGASTVAELVSENRHGNPQYLEQARKALADVRKMWGVDAPARMTLDARPFAALSDAALDAELARQARLLRGVDASAIVGEPSPDAPPAGEESDE